MVAAIVVPVCFTRESLSWANRAPKEMLEAQTGAQYLQSGPCNSEIRIEEAVLNATR